MPGTPRNTQAEPHCACGSGKPAVSCCSVYINGTSLPPTAEALMRSRYCAYAGGQVRYLLETWHSDTRPTALDLPPEQRWLGLKILATSGGTDADSEGTVEFVARFKLAGRGYRLHELSRFVQTSDGWMYLDGTPGRTDSSLKS